MIDLRSHTPKGQRARAKILAAAEDLLIERGFHGTSMRDAATAAGLPLATVVYHFARKEQLYATILEAIGSELVVGLDAVMGSAAVSLSGGAGDTIAATQLPRAARTALAAARVEAFIRALVAWTQSQPGRVKLLLRELLDNPSRVAKAARLPLAPFLDRATELIADAQRAGAILTQPPELAVLHVVGALSYVVAAQPTVDRIVGRQRARALAADYAGEAVRCARRVLGCNVPERRAR